MCLRHTVYVVTKLTFMNNKVRALFFPYKYYLNTVTCTVSKHTTTVLSCYHINITLTQSYVPSVNTQLQSCHVMI